MKDFHRFFIVCIFELNCSVISDVKTMEHFHRFHIVVKLAQIKEAASFIGFTSSIINVLSWLCYVARRCNIDETCLLCTNVKDLAQISLFYHLQLIIGRN